MLIRLTAMQTQKKTKMTMTSCGREFCTHTNKREYQAGKN